MNTKLTMRLDESLILQAKLYARKNGISLSRLVANYFALLVEKSNQHKHRIEREQLSPITRRLYGVLCNKGVSEEDY